MSSKNIPVNFLLPPSLWRQLAKAAAEVGHARAPFIRMGLALMAQNPQLFIPRASPAPIDTSGLFARSTAAPIAPPPHRPTIPTLAPMRPATEQEARELAEYNAEAIDDVITLEEFRIKRPQIASKMGWDEPSRPLAEAAAESQTSDAAPAHERVTPATHDNIPSDWVNEYGLTLAQQNALGREDDLEYGPPAARPGVAH